MQHCTVTLSNTVPAYRKLLEKKFEKCWWIARLHLNLRVRLLQLGGCRGGWASPRSQVIS